MKVFWLDLPRPEIRHIEAYFARNGWRANFKSDPRGVVWYKEYMSVLVFNSDEIERRERGSEHTRDLISSIARWEDRKKVDVYLDIMKIAEASPE